MAEGRQVERRIGSKRTLPSTLTATLPIDKAISLPLTVGSGATVPTDADRAKAGMT